MKKVLIMLTVLFAMSSCGKDSQPQEEQKPQVSAVSINQSEVELYLNESVQLSATVTPQNAEYELIWNSSAPETATVDETGLVTPVSEGVADICAEAGGIVASCRVTVIKPEFINYIDEYDVNHGKGIKIDDIVWAPVNCGYHETDFQYGKLYQWGRKYGHRYTTSYDESVPEIVEGPISAADGQKEEYSNTFFISILEEYNYDWCSPQDDKLWNSGTDSEPVKTEYDPCPEGWRVPTYSELWALRKNHSSWTINPEGQKGYWFSGSVTYSSSVPQIFFPAGGFLGCGDGVGHYRNSDGYYWSSAPYGTNAGTLYFFTDGVDMYGHGRANGQYVRCVQATDEVAEL